MSQRTGTGSASLGRSRGEDQIGVSHRRRTEDWNELKDSQKTLIVHTSIIEPGTLLREEYAAFY